MTCIGTIQHEWGVSIFADGGADNGFRVVKIWPLPHLNACIATRGPWIAGSFVANVFGVSATYSELKRNALGAFKDALNHVTAYSTNDKALEVYCVAWSQNGPDSFAIFSHDRDSVEPFTIINLAPNSLAPSLPGFESRFGSGEPFDFDTEVIRIGEAWRALPDHTQQARNFLQIATVTDDLIVTRILKRWP
jgi:hypothetical protein